MSELGSSVVIYSSWFLSSIYFLSLSVVGVDVVFVAVAAVSISAISNGDLLWLFFLILRLFISLWSSKYLSLPLTSTLLAWREVKADEIDSLSLR